MGMPSRILSIVVALPGGFLALLLVIAALLGEQGTSPLNFILTISQKDSGRWIISTLGILYLLGIGRFLLLLKARFPKDRALIAQSALGKVQISQNAMESLIQKAAKGIVGVRGIRVKIRNVDGGVAILLNVDAELDAGLAGMGEKLQQITQDILESAVGISVKEVRVMVERIGLEEKSRARVR